MADDISPFHACRKCTCSALRRTSRAVTQHYEACFRGTGLRATQFTLLATLAQTGPQPLNALATMLGLERTTLSRNLALLEKKGYISKVTDTDQRVRRISITQKGETAALMALDAWKQAQATVEKMLEEMGGVGLKIPRCG
ncbi:MAG: MarR family winged helix-turn-helix transcriptional regulator [Burkholderiales bacterium]